MKIKNVFLAAVLVGSSATALADPTPNPDTSPDASAKLSTSDKAELAHLHAINQMEIMLGKLAQSNSTTAGVKTFGMTLVTDHTSADNDLTSFAKKHNANIAQDTAMSDADKQAKKDAMTTITKLKTMHGPDFDHAFLSMTVSDHGREISKLDIAIAGASNAELADMLKNLKPVMQSHETTARDLANNAPQAAN